MLKVIFCICKLDFSILFLQQNIEFAILMEHNSARTAFQALYIRCDRDSHTFGRGEGLSMTSPVGCIL